jgi:H/ACA ribonucleoprotein complex subunit 2
MSCRLVIIAGDISPIDVITHVPILCEDANIPYIYVPSKEVRPCLIASFVCIVCVLVLSLVFSVAYAYLKQ